MTLESNFATSSDHAESFSDIKGGEGQGQGASQPRFTAKPHIASTDANSGIDEFMQMLDADNLLMIPKGVQIKSDLFTNNLSAVVIAGRVEGDIDAGDWPVIVKAGGEVLGRIKSTSYVVIAGKVVAPTDESPAVLTQGLWVLAQAGYVKGTVAYGRQRAYEGGVFNGRAIPYAEFKG